MSPYPILAIAIFIVVALGFFVLAAIGRLPSLDSWVHFLESFNTKGGNLFLLSMFTLLFSTISIRSYLYIIDLSVHGQVQQDNTYALQMVQWVTGGLTIGFMGALLKTMTGDAPTVTRDQGIIDTKNQKEKEEKQTT